MNEKKDNSVLITTEEYEKLKKFKLRAEDNFYVIEILASRLLMLYNFIGSPAYEQDKIIDDILLTIDEIVDKCKKYGQFLKNYDSFES